MQGDAHKEVATFRTSSFSAAGYGNQESSARENAQFPHLDDHRRCHGDACLLRLGLDEVDGMPSDWISTGDS